MIDNRLVTPILLNIGIHLHSAQSLLIGYLPLNYLQLNLINKNDTLALLYTPAYSIPDNHQDHSHIQIDCAIFHCGVFLEYIE